VSPTNPSDPHDPRAATPLEYAPRVPARGVGDDTREVMGCLLAWLVLVSGLVAGMAWFYWSAVNTL
jgi:hypothetical protein